MRVFTFAEAARSRGAHRRGTRGVPPSTWARPRAPSSTGASPARATRAPACPGTRSGMPSSATDVRSRPANARACRGRRRRVARWFGEETPPSWMCSSVLVALLSTTGGRGQGLSGLLIERILRDLAGRCGFSSLIAPVRPTCRSATRSSRLGLRGLDARDGLPSIRGSVLMPAPARSGPQLCARLR